MSNEKLVPKLRFDRYVNKTHWNEYLLEDCAFQIGDGLHGTPEYVNEGKIYFINGNNLQNNKIILTNDTKRVSPVDHLKNNKNLDTNTILMSINGTIGNLAFYNNENVMLGKSVAFIKLKNVNKLYINFYLQIPKVQNYFMNSLTGSTIKNLGLEAIRKTKMLIPSVDEQKEISVFLKKVSNMIQLQQSKVNKVKDIKSAYLSEMFPKEGEKYPKKRFQGFTEPWKIYKLGELGQFRSNGVNKKIKVNDNPAYLLNYMNVYNKLNINQKNYKNLMKVTATNRELQDNNIIKNDVFFTPTSETADDIGRVLTIEHDLPETVYSYHLIRFRPFEDSVYATFPNYGFATQYLRKQMETAAQGVQRFVIGITVFEDIKVYLPPYEEQEKIAKFFKNLDNQISNEEEKLEKLEKLKQAYLNDMFV